MHRIKSRCEACCLPKSCSSCIDGFDSAYASAVQSSIHVTEAFDFSTYTSTGRCRTYCQQLVQRNTEKIKTCRHLLHILWCSTGRAGRDGQSARCMLMYRFADALRQAAIVNFEPAWQPNLYAVMQYAAALSSCRRALICRSATEMHYVCLTVLTCGMTCPCQSMIEVVFSTSLITCTCTMPISRMQPFAAASLACLCC